MDKCPYCSDTGFLDNGYIEKTVSGHRVLYPYTEPCYCKVNKSINKRYSILSALPLPIPEDTDKVHERFQNKNFLMYGTEEYFLYIVKSFFMKGFMYKDFIVLEGATIVEKYHAVREDWLTTSHLNQYDLLALLFTSSVKYSNLQDCIVDVIKNRNRIAKPTWIYMPYDPSVGDNFKKVKEYSEDLKGYIDEKKFPRYNVDNGIKLKGFSTVNKIWEKNEKALNNDGANW